MSKKRILVAVLNWGLGHATRSAPVIRALETEGFEPVLASAGAAFDLLSVEFPHLTRFKLPDYPITYSERAKFLKWKLFLKSPLFLRTIVAEKHAVDRIVKTERIEGIISDNCPGAWSRSVPSAFITHQIQVLSGNTTVFTTAAHQYFINKFSECWIPDREANGLSGKMSDSRGLKIPVKYIGINSRLKRMDLPQKYDLTVVLSGPEPQRGLLEKILLEKLAGCDGNTLFIRGKIEKQQSSQINANLQIVNFLSGREMETALNQSGMILARSGYSTLLDLAVLEKKAFFIPTPGQYEQEYLAARMKDLGIAAFCRQEDFSRQQLKSALGYSGFSGFNTTPDYRRLFSLFEAK